MSEEIIKVLDALAEKLGIAVDWTSANVIPYLESLCNKYVNYELATSVVWILIGICLLIMGKILFPKIKQYYEKSDGMDEDNVYSYVCVLVISVSTVAIVSGAAIIFCEIFDIVTCLAFPEKIIIDELRHLYSSMNP